MDDSQLLNELKIDRGDRDDDTGARPRWLWPLLVVVALAVAGGGYWWYASAQAIAVETVTASAPAAGDSGAVLQATGYVTARRQATVSAQIVGTLTEVLIEEGDHVKKGQVLARLEDSAQRARLNAAKAGAAAAQARVAQVRTQLAQAERDERRQSDLVKRKLVPEQQAEQARTSARVLRAQLNSAEADATAAKAQVAVAQVNYDYTVVRAPFAGVITQKTAQVGEIIAPSAAGGGYTRTGVGTIVDMNSLEVDVDVNESYIGRVKPHMPAEAVLDAYPDWKIPAHVIAIVPAADRGKATVKVRVALDQKDSRIVPDMGVRVSFLDQAASKTSAPPKGVLVPASAILTRQGAAVVFTLDDGRAKMHEVKLADQHYGDMRLIPDGIAAGAAVIDNPPEDLADGTTVTPAKR